MNGRLPCLIARKLAREMHNSDAVSVSSIQRQPTESQPIMIANPPKKAKPLGRRKRYRRRGVLTLEAILILPILILVTLAGIEFGVLVLGRQAVSHAATVAVREAAKGADMDELETVIERVLRLHNITVGDCASFVLEDPTATTPVEQRGAFGCCHPSTPSLDLDEVRVTVCVEMGKRPFLNALKSFGLDLSGRRMVATAFAKKEAA